MKISERDEVLLRKALESNGMADLSQFHTGDDGDEVPLYSRESDIDFLLQDYDIKGTNTVLLGFAVKYLQSVIAHKKHVKPYFAAITVWNYSKEEPIIPNLFVHPNPDDLKGLLRLQDATTLFAKKMARLVSRLELSKEFVVFEDRVTDPDMVRVFIGPSSAPYKEFVLLRKFRSATHSAK